MIEIGLKLLLITAHTLISLAMTVGFWGQHLEAHTMIGTASVLFYLFVCVCVIFYFVGTGVWMRDHSQRMLAQNKPKALQIWDYYQKANKLKAKSMPFASLGIVFGLFTFILGGATQVGAVYSWVHPSLAVLLVITAWISQRFIFSAIHDNIGYLDNVSELLQS